MNRFTKGEWSVKDSDVMVGDTTIATTYSPSDLDLSLYTFNNNVVGSNFEVGLLVKDANAHLIATAGTIATKLAEAGYDAVKVLEVLPQLVNSTQIRDLYNIPMLLEQCRGDEANQLREQSK